jgi:uncharacterized phage-associated protein
MIVEDKIKISTSALDSKTITLPASDFSTMGTEVLPIPSTTRSDEAVLSLDGKTAVLADRELEIDLQVSVHDVAAFILERQGEMTAMKLQKLVYYAQAWSLVWDEAPLFNEPIEAWANGPVVRALYNRHQGRFKVKEWNGNPRRLSGAQRETIEKVLEFYGGMSSQTLSDLTHQESPWREARQGLGPTERGARIISLASMAEYYSSLG